MQKNEYNICSGGFNSKTDYHRCYGSNEFLIGELFNLEETVWGDAYDEAIDTCRRIFRFNNFYEQRPGFGCGTC